MSSKKRKKKSEGESNPFKMVIYIVSVVALVACIVFFVYRDFQKENAFEEQVAELSSQEKADMWDEFEQERFADRTQNEENPETVSEENPVATDGNGTPRKKSAAENEDGSDIVTDTGNETGADIIVEETPTPEPVVTDMITTEPVQDVSPTPLPSLTPLPTDVQAALLSITPPPEETASLSVLILNGTRRQGVAGYWKNVLDQAGYKNVVPATYTGTVGPQTVIYASSIADAEPLLQLFPNASIQVGSVTTGIEATTGYPLPEHTDIFVMVGSNDARSS